MQTQKQRRVTKNKYGKCGNMGVLFYNFVRILLREKRYILPLCFFTLFLIDLSKRFTIYGDWIHSFLDRLFYNRSIAYTISKFFLKVVVHVVIIDQ